MELRRILLGIIILGSIDVINIFKGSPPAASAEKVEDNPYVDQGLAAQTPEHDEWSALNHGVKISYCTSCSMKGAFMQVKEYVEREFPGVPIAGETYPIASHKQLLKKLVTGVQLGVAAMMIGGEQILRGLGINDPQAMSFLAKMKEKKFPVLMSTWVLGNMVQNALSSTGAFEVFSGGEKIFSKLDSGRMPGLEELYDSLVKTLQPASLDASQ